MFKYAKVSTDNHKASQHKIKRTAPEVHIDSIVITDLTENKHV